MTRPHAARTRFERDAASVVRHARRGLADELRSGREDAGLSVRRLAHAAGVSPTTLAAIEQDRVEPSLQVVARVATVLGLRLSVRLYPGTGPLIRDHLQALLIRALLSVLHERWTPRPEVAVYQPVRGVIDLVLSALRGNHIACEAHSELRRLELQVRWSQAEADALAAGTAGGEETTPGTVGRLLLLRSTSRTRAIVAQHGGLLAATYHSRSADAYAALTGEAPWPGDALLWCRIEGGSATLLEHPPRGIRVGR